MYGSKTSGLFETDLFKYRDGSSIFFFLHMTFSRAGQSLCTQIVRHIKQEVLDFNAYKKNIAEPIIGYMPRSTS